ncbi:MAG TPA: LPXTG cell wall anchor domain-containing protein [Streptosporangiaceae bacterium]|nr:LPXTG cell wall anchor domain-containing protein [Streptosporangiaceae bacterium]
MSKFAWPGRMAKIAMLTTVFAAGGTGIALASGSVASSAGSAGNHATTRVSVPADHVGAALQGNEGRRSSGSSELGRTPDGNGGSPGGQYKVVISLGHHSSNPCRKAHGQSSGGRETVVIRVAQHNTKPCCTDYGSSYRRTVITAYHHSTKPCRKDYGRTIATTVRRASKPCRKGYGNSHSAVVVSTYHHSSKPCRKGHEAGQSRDYNLTATGGLKTGIKPQLQLTNASYTVSNGLPTTGADITGLVAVAGLATAFGSGALFLARRRRTSKSSLR